MRSPLEDAVNLRLSKPAAFRSRSSAEANVWSKWLSGWMLLLAFGCTTAPHDEPTGVETQPLSAADGQPAKQLMERLEPMGIGIDFVHQWKPRNRYEALLLKTGFTGGGVCMGDYDSDGQTDVLLTRPHGGPQLYRNKGGFRFENVTRSARRDRIRSLDDRGRNG